MHISETCEDDLPNLITNVATAAGPISDGDATIPVLESLSKKDLLPSTHIVDTGYLDAKLLVTSQKEFGVDLPSPARPDYKWQARAKQGFADECFQVDWQKQQAICPEGKISTSWSSALDYYGQETIKIKFAQKDCIACPGWSRCTTAARRAITLRKQEHHLALLAARAREETPDYKSEYARRASIEGTISQGVRAFGLRRARYIGLAKTHLQQVITATAINFFRISNWLWSIPWEKTRTSASEKLMRLASSSCCLISPAVSKVTKNHFSVNIYRDDAVLFYPHLGSKREGRGRQKKYQGKVEVKNLDFAHLVIAHCFSG